jgi:enterochelin esterase-like enzyme
MAILAFPLSIGAQTAPGNSRDLLDVASSQRDFVVGPEYVDAPETVLGDGVPPGTIHPFEMRSEDSQIFPGVTGPYVRNVSLYLPAGYLAGSEVPFMVVQDGVRQFSRRTAPILDNLIHQKRIPAMAVVFIDPGPGDGPGSERGFEYDHISEAYVNFIETEVLPRAERDFGVRFTTDPEGRAAMGASSGAAAALTMAWFRPDLYGKVLSYSGTFVNQQRLPESAYPRGAWEYHASLIPQNDPKPIRIWLHVSEQDNGATRAEETFGNWVLANQHMREVLSAKEYDYRYVFSLESRHSDGRVVAQTLPAALEWLWRGYTLPSGSTR